MTKLICAGCDKEFNRKLDSKNKNNIKHYCSRGCFQNNNKSGEIKECCGCHKTYYVKNYVIESNSSGFFFCSKACSRNPPDAYRKLISDKRKEYLKNNPEKHVWKRDSKFISVPCEKVKEYLKNNNIEFIEEFAPSQEHSYSIDIAFPEKRIGIEINGAQHYERNGQLKPYYQERHEHIEKLGWKIYQIYYSLCFDENFILDLINKVLISGTKIDFNYSEYIQLKLDAIYEQKQIKLTKKLRILTPIPPRHELEKLLETMTQQEVAKHFHVTDQIVMRWRGKYNLKLNIRSDYNPRSTFLLRKTTSNCSCGNPKVKNAKCCRECATLKMRKTIRPSKEKLHYLMWNYPNVELSKMFGVSDSAISKWCKIYGLVKPGRGYWAKFQYGHVIDYQI